MLPALVVFQYFLVQFAPATKGYEKRTNHTEPHCQPPTAELQSGRASAVQWVSSVTRALARCPGPGTSCLLSVAADVAWHRVASAANQFRFHLQFYSR